MPLMGWQLSRNWWRLKYIFIDVWSGHIKQAHVSSVTWTLALHQFWVPAAYRILGGGQHTQQTCFRTEIGIETAERFVAHTQASSCETQVKDWPLQSQRQSPNLLQGVPEVHDRTLTDSLWLCGKRGNIPETGVSPTLLLADCTLTGDLGASLCVNV